MNLETPAYLFTFSTILYYNTIICLLLLIYNALTIFYAEFFLSIYFLAWSAATFAFSIWCYRMVL